MSRPERTTPLRVASDRTGVDMKAARRAAADFLNALGIDTGREELRETPSRMARAYAELFDPRAVRLTTFPNDEGYDELVLARARPQTQERQRVLRARGRAKLTLGTQAQPEG
jgi:GTP cyclohydrolase I